MRRVGHIDYRVSKVHVRFNAEVSMALATYPQRQEPPATWN